MSETRDALSLAFMRGHPAQAARVLEALPAADAAAMFDRAPARLCAAVLAAMLPRQAAHCMADLSDARCLELLASMNTQATVALLRHVNEARRRTLIAGLPTASAMASTLLLGYTDDTVGAWADPDVVALPGDSRVGDALERLRQSDVEAHPLLFVTTAERRLSGVVGLAALWRAPADAALATLMQRPHAVLAAHAPLAGAPAHPGWGLASALPVVDAGQRLVGLMTRDALSRALRRVAPETPAANASASLPTLLAGGYWQALSGLLESGLVVLPRVPPVLGDGDGR